MPRPCKRRRVCAMPGCGRFAPATPGQHPAVEMGVDEYECIRLIDLEGLNQEECAARMQVARTTAQAIYNSARRKLALCLVQGRELVIRGGNYDLCQGGSLECGSRCCHRSCHTNCGKGNPTDE